MRTCPKCGASYGDGERFCADDGASLVVSREVARDTMPLPDPRLGTLLDGRYRRQIVAAAAGRHMLLGPGDAFPEDRLKPLGFDKGVGDVAQAQNHFQGIGLKNEEAGQVQCLVCDHVEGKSSFAGVLWRDVGGVHQAASSPPWAIWSAVALARRKTSWHCLADQPRA